MFRVLFAHSFSLHRSFLLPQNVFPRPPAWIRHPSCASFDRPPTPLGRPMRLRRSCPSFVQPLFSTPNSAQTTHTIEEVLPLFLSTIILRFSIRRIFPCNPLPPSGSQHLLSPLFHSACNPLSPNNSPHVLPPFFHSTRFDDDFTTLDSTALSLRPSFT